MSKTNNHLTVQSHTESRTKLLEKTANSESEILLQYVYPNSLTKVASPSPILDPIWLNLGSCHWKRNFPGVKAI